jgi:hypothetical protein
MDPIVDLILTHVARYPKADVMDIYKLLHQATFGPGHAISNKKTTREYLEQEISQIEPVRNATLVESIHPTDEIVRLHLRPYLAYQNKVRPLLDAFVRSADQVQGDPAVMATRWQAFEALCRDGTLEAERFPLREVMLFGRVRAREQWPAVHHSPAFASAYRPRYRVLTGIEAEALCDKIGAAYEAV